MLKQADFVVGQQYYIRTQDGQPHRCVHVDSEIVVFRFYYQGTPRVYWAPLKELRKEDFAGSPFKEGNAARFCVRNERIVRKQH